MPYYVERVLTMKTMRKLALISAACLMLTALPLPAAAADDPVLTQVAAVKNDKFTVDAKKLGYTALNGECPERPVWYHMSEYEKKNYKNDDEWWKAEWKKYVESGNYYGFKTDDGFEVAPAHYAVSNSVGYGVIKDGYISSPSGFSKISIIDKEGNIDFSTALTDYNQNDYAAYHDLFSAATRLYWYSEGGLRGAHYLNMKTGECITYPIGSNIYNGFATVLENLEAEKSFDDGFDKIKCQLSVINDKGEKVLTLSEPIELVNAMSAGADGFDVTGYNYTMNLGGYSEDLIWFACDRQLGATLNDLIPNTGEDKDVESVKRGEVQVSNQYKFAEHECGYADLQGNVVIPQIFDFVSPFIDGIALAGIIVDNSNQWNPVYKYGFIDKTGNFIVEPKYYSDSWNGGTGSFSEGFAKVALQDDQDTEGSPKLKYGFIDKTGKEVIALQYEDAGDFQNGLAKVKKDGKWGYINTKGETVLPFEYADTCGSDGTCFVVGKEIDSTVKYGAVDASGSTILPFIFEDMSNPVNGLVYAFCDRELYSLEIAEVLETGDFNGDGEISVEDAQLTLRAYTEHVAGLESKLTPGQKKAADINDDGEVSVEDAQLILRYYTEKTVAGKDITWDDLLKQ